MARVLLRRAELEPFLRALGLPQARNRAQVRPDLEDVGPEETVDAGIVDVRLRQVKVQLVLEEGVNSPDRRHEVVVEKGDSAGSQVIGQVCAVPLGPVHQDVQLVSDDFFGEFFEHLGDALFVHAFVAAEACPVPFGPVSDGSLEGLVLLSVRPLVDQEV